jgi:hypothetical protein
MTEEPETSAPAALPFWLRPVSIFGRLKVTTFKREFTYVSHAVHPCPLPP